MRETFARIDLYRLHHRMVLGADIDELAVNENENL